MFEEYDPGGNNEIAPAAKPVIRESDDFTSSVE